MRGHRSLRVYRLPYEVQSRTPASALPGAASSRRSSGRSRPSLSTPTPPLRDWPTWWPRWSATCPWSSPTTPAACTRAAGCPICSSGCTRRCCARACWPGPPGSSRRRTSSATASWWVPGQVLDSHARRRHRTLHAGAHPYPGPGALRRRSPAGPTPTKVWSPAALVQRRWLLDGPTCTFDVVGSGDRSGALPELCRTLGIDTRVASSDGWLAPTWSRPTRRPPCWPCRPPTRASAWCCSRPWPAQFPSCPPRSGASRQWWRTAAPGFLVAPGDAGRVHRAPRPDSRRPRAGSPPGRSGPR